MERNPEGIRSRNDQYLLLTNIGILHDIQSSFKNLRHSQKFTAA
jgi:hypothetical protein